MFLLVFGDIVQLFGMFSKGVSWMIAIILAIIIANIQIIKVIAVGALTITSVLGAFSVLASILLIFVLFFLFHFGTEKWRNKMIMRRAQSAALRATAGGKKAASAVGILKDIAEEAAKGES
jgi:hypothetical protein